MSAAAIHPDTRVALVWLAFCAVMTATILVRLWQSDRRNRREADRDAVAEAVGILTPRSPFALSPETQASRAGLRERSAKAAAMRGRR